MKKQLLAVLAALMLTPLIGLAQIEPMVTATIPFKFVVDGTKLPSGPYEFKLMGTELNVMQITDTKTGNGVLVPIMATARPQSRAVPRVVFDKNHNRSYLSEVVIPDMDGYLFAPPTGKHQQTTIPGTN